ncbi:DUF86 domain-containing protein [Caldicellulosiruptoraceae bacterium PP1]
MDDKLLSHIRLLYKYIEILEKISNTSFDEYEKDDILKGAIERYLQVAIETCLNIGSRIISLEQFKNNINLPETYADIFRILSEINVIDKDFAKNLSNMAKFRNRLVHMYWEIDDRLIYDIVKNNLVDLKKFIEMVIKYIDNKNN